ncbi:glycosyltransferase, partial [Bordetella pertussis]|uniref:glycosyltransferase n=1 Tax=Bordetella pertussis TaxID=520 RepID=UPI00387A30D1
GRLHPDKGFDVLIDAYARIAPRYPDWDLVILGEGEECAALCDTGPREIVRPGVDGVLVRPAGDAGAMAQ